MLTMLLRAAPSGEAGGNAPMTHAAILAFIKASLQAQTFGDASWSLKGLIVACVWNRTQQRGAAGLQQRQQPEQQCQPSQRSEPPAPHREESGELGRQLREAAAGPRGHPLLLGRAAAPGWLLALAASAGC